MAWIYDIGKYKYFTTAQQENNVLEIYNYFRNYDMTLEALCGILGNMSKESTMNPGIKQGDDPSLGWGLIQWSPHHWLVDWCEKLGLDWYDGNAQLRRIVAEGEKTTDDGYSWWNTVEGYRYSWREYCQITDVDLALEAYFYIRIRAGKPDMQTRYEWAHYWYEFLSGEEPPVPPVPPTPSKKKKGMPVWMMVRRRIF